MGIISNPDFFIFHPGVGSWFLNAEDAAFALKHWLETKDSWSNSIKFQTSKSKHKIIFNFDIHLYWFQSHRINGTIV